MTSWLRWDDTPRYEPGFKVGSCGEKGEHLRTHDGWPYSIYRMAAVSDGTSDMVLCHGIQNYEDAVEICAQLQALA